MLFQDYNNYLNLLLKLALCEYFDFNRFMPSDPHVFRPVIELLRRKQCPGRVEERFYDFCELQKSESGKEFLLEFNIIFSKEAWMTSQFTANEVKEILLRIHTSPPSQIEYLNIYPLEHILKMGYDKSNFFGTDGRWNMFSIPSFHNYVPDLNNLLLWLKQIRPQVAKDDLLFYRLAYLSWYYYEYRLSGCHQRPYVEFADSAIELLTEAVYGKEFRGSVLEYYFQREENRWMPLSEIPSYILGNNPVSRATLHFENFIADYNMGYKWPFDKIIWLFQKFKPSQVSPFVCRELLGHIEYHEFTSLLKNALREWKELYLETPRANSYFPTRLLSANVQLSLWRHQKLIVKDFGDFNQHNVLYLNHPRLWKQYIEGVLEDALVEKNGFTYIDCNAEQDLIEKLIYRRIVWLLLYGSDLPKFIPLRQGCNTYLKESNSTINKRIVERLCIEGVEKQPNYEHVANLQRTIIQAFMKWDVPEIFLHHKLAARSH